MGLGSAFVDILAALIVVLFISIFAHTLEAADGVFASRVISAVASICRTLVNVIAFHASSLEAVVTGAREAPGCVCARCRGVAVVGTCCAFINVCARVAILVVALRAAASVGPERVCADTTFLSPCTVIFSCALVDVRALPIGSAVSSVACFARADSCGAFFVFLTVSRTIASTAGAEVNFIAAPVHQFIPRIRFHCIATVSIDAVAVGGDRCGGVRAFINVRAALLCVQVAVTFLALALVATNSV